MSDNKSARRGDWISTGSKRQFYPIDPRPEDIDIKSIAISLGNLCRYGGHIEKGFYSVAEHSVLMCTYFLNKHMLELAWEALLHDASEAYMGSDVPYPIKRYLSDYKDLELQIQRAISAKFNVPVDKSPEVHKADIAIRSDERVELGIWDTPWAGEPEPLGVIIRCWAPYTARMTFLRTYELMCDKLGRAY